MPQPEFENLRQRLLLAGIAPRHVNRYLAELRDHFDDLVREAMAQGKERFRAEAEARSRLGDESVLAQTMLEQPAMRSYVARYPWAAFVLGPIAMLVAALAATLAIEVAVLSLIGPMRNPSHLPPPVWFMYGVGLWNSLPSIIAPVAIAGLIYLVGSRQRMPIRWVFLGVVIACVLGAFQDLTFNDDGYHGELSVGWALMPVIGVERAFANLAVVSGAAWVISRLGARRSMSSRESGWGTRIRT